MNPAVIIILIIVIVVLIVFGQTIFMRLFGDRAADAIDNAITRKKTSSNPQKKEKLSDIYSIERNRMFCNNCGAEANDGSKFCMNCGQALNG
ncbi:MAG: zinc ribbon domain-containing protein [Oscillospiraceae bacterium]|nr:zinc ribbon domain-containing protein [Oscillospiraceae bacterium]